MPDATSATPPEVIVALDVPTAERALALVDLLPGGTWLKVGLELFTRAGPSVVERLAGDGHRVFLDLKLHDIPNTVAGAVRSVAGLGAELLTVHAAGGEAMLRAAVDAAGSAAGPPLRLLGITVLTSLDDAALAAVMGAGATVEGTVARLAGLASESGVHGAVCSVAEAPAVRGACRDRFLVVTPGIRLPGDEAHDQRRVATPAVARAAGANYLVVGRSITRADDPAGALEAVRRALDASS